ncbi:MAG: helix-turn-helix domain-containing protein [Roseburia sp.]|nr:helix-turn-helix domain-containing protein [Roseburia sp.]
MGTQTDLYDLSHVGLRIRNYREAKHISQEQLAHRTGFSTGTIGKIERGISNPKTSTLMRIARELGVPCRSFFDQPDVQKKHVSPIAGRLLKYIKFLDETELRLLCMTAETLIRNKNRSRTVDKKD